MLNKLNTTETLQKRKEMETSLSLKGRPSIHGKLNGEVDHESSP